MSKIPNAGRLPQIGVPLANEHIKRVYQEIVQKRFGLRMADFLRHMVEEVVETYGNLSREQKIEYNLGNKAIGGPHYMRQVVNDWKRQHLDLANQIDLELEAEQSQHRHGKKGNPGNPKAQRLAK